MIQILGNLKKIYAVIDFIKNEPYIRCSLNEQPFETTIQSSDQFPDLIIPSKTVLNSWTKISGKELLIGFALFIGFSFGFNERLDGPVWIKNLNMSHNLCL